MLSGTPAWGDPHQRPSAPLWDAGPVSSGRLSACDLEVRAQRASWQASTSHRNVFINLPLLYFSLTHFFTVNELTHLIINEFIGQLIKQIIPSFVHHSCPTHSSIISPPTHLPLHHPPPIHAFLPSLLARSAGQCSWLPPGNTVCLPSPLFANEVPGHSL